MKYNDSESYQKLASAVNAGEGSSSEIKGHYFFMLMRWLVLPYSISGISQTI